MLLSVHKSRGRCVKFVVFFFAYAVTKTGNYHVDIFENLSVIYNPHFFGVFVSYPCLFEIHTKDYMAFPIFPTHSLVSDKCLHKERAGTLKFGYFTSFHFRR
jgi:hypothetical protein